MDKILLNGEWNLKSGDGKEICKGGVPSCNYTDLFNQGIIDNPIIDTNEETLQWVSHKEWEYSRPFEVDKTLLAKDKILLVFEQIDTLATIYINQQVVGKTASAHVKYEFDIKDFLKEGGNDIRVVFHPPFEKIKELQKKFAIPIKSLGEHGNPHLRFPQYHFGWDWGPHFVSCGMTRDVYICGYDDRILDVFIKQKHENKKVILEITAGSEKGAKNGFSGELRAPSGQTISISFEGRSSKVVVENPEIWWCNGLGNQPLYQLHVTLKNEDESILDLWSKNIGLREIELSLVQDDNGADFCFLVNKQRVFAKGSNWIPTDIFISNTTYETLDFLVGSARTANMNMIRVWGGGYFERNDFYDLCDKYGILVWQDLMFACTPYQWDREDFYNLTIRELEDNVRRIRHHASLALWCGNNEIESVAQDWKLLLPKLAKDLVKYFYEDVPNRLKDLDPNTPYWPASPSSGTPFKDYTSDRVGDTHIWAVWHGLLRPEHYNTRKTRFCSEFGMQSLPTLNAIDIFAKDSRADLTSKEMQVHQKCASGNKRMKYYMNQMFWSPQKTEDYVYLSQVVQSECMEVAVNGWRLMEGICNGALIWQFNDCWGVNSWAAIDYYNNYKALQYRSRHFFSNVIAYPIKTKNSFSIKVVNDSQKEENLTLKYAIGEIDSENKWFSIPVTIKENANINIQRSDEDKFSITKKTYLILSLLDSFGNEIMRKGILFNKNAARKLPPSDIKYDVSKENETINITLTPSAYARFIEVRIKGENSPLSDNFFDLTPGEAKTISLTTSLSEKEIRERIEIKSLVDIKPGKSRFRDKFEAIKVFLTPVNFFSYIYYVFLQ